MIELLTVTPEHFKNLAQYLASYPDETRDVQFWLDRFRLWWTKNPACQDRFERGWILTENGEIVGFLGNFPTRFQLAGKMMIIHNATTWRVSPNYRNHSLRLLFKQIANSRGSMLFMTTPNEPVVKVLKSMNYQRIERAGRGMSFLIASSVNFLAKCMPNNLITILFSKLLAPVLDLVQNFRCQACNQRGGFRVEEISRADLSFDELWEDTKKLYPNTNARTSEFINWYCFGSKNFAKKIFAVYEGKSLIAYMMFVNPPGRKWNSLECIDFFGRINNQKAVAALVGYLRTYAQENRIDLIKFPHFSAETARLYKTLGLFEMKSKEREEYFKVNFEISEPITVKNTYFSYIVGDVGL